MEDGRESTEEMRAMNILPPEEVAAQRDYLRRVREWNAAQEAALGTAQKAYILTFGCQQNEADSEKLAGMAEAMGYEIVGEPAEADLIVVNTCAIREHAEKKALSTVGQFKHLKAKKSDMIIAVCGCMVTQAHRVEEIKHRYPYVDFVFGTSSIHRFPQLLWEKREKGKRL